MTPAPCVILFPKPYSRSLKQKIEMGKKDWYIIRNNGHSLFSLFIDISGDCLVETNIRTAVLDTWPSETPIQRRSQLNFEEEL